MYMINRNKYLPFSLDFINRATEYSIVWKQHKHIFNGSPHITIMNVFVNKNIVGSYSNQDMFYIGIFVTLLPECYGHCNFNQLNVQLLFCKL